MASEVELVLLTVYCRVIITRRMQANTVTPDQIQKFQRDGYLLVPTLFDGDEMELLRRVATKDQALNANTQGSADGKGRHIKLALWIEQGDDIYGLFSRSRRIVDNIELLLGGEVYHFHSKMIQKEALAPYRLSTTEEG